MNHPFHITNCISNKNHPLYKLLIDSIQADTGSSCSQNLAKARQIPNWQHYFSHFDKTHTSVEILSWDGDETFRKLQAIYA